ncbi:MAG: Gx transporter family protein [bacterium]|nr:Gx transporter family protein [bacterium]
MESKKLVRLSLMLALGLILGLVENILPPLPVPGVKLGLANIVNVVVLYSDGFIDSLLLSLARVMILSIFLGSLLSITFYISLSGAIASVTGMSLVYDVFGRDLSPISVSSFGAFMHILAQLLTVSILMNTRDVLYLFPILSLLGVITGIITGLVSSYILKLKL